MNGIEEGPEEGEVDSSAPAPNKVHIRGLDTLTTGDVRNYAAEHYSLDLFKRVEWINDTSANLVYDTDAAAAEALTALSAEEATEPLRLRRAHQLSTHPNMELEIRQAIIADTKQPGAKDRSRFYLFNPEYDPDSRATGVRKRRRNDDRGGNGRRREDDRFNRRSSRDEQPFDVNFYDDAAAPALRHRKSEYSAGESSRRKVTFGEDLFGNKNHGRLRDRSASPVRDGDGKYGFEEDQPYRRSARRRSLTPPRALHETGRGNQRARDGLRKELFPDRKPSDPQSNPHTDVPVSSMTLSKELFPDKVLAAAHRRSDAQNLKLDQVADIIGKYTLDGMDDRVAYSMPDERPSARRGRDLFSRISGGPKMVSSHGRLNQDEADGPGYNIRGAGRSEGFSILGASRENAENPLVKELFPLKSGTGEAKDLFDGRIKGRAAARRRAEDLF